MGPDARFDEAIDHVFVIGRGGPAQDAPVVINGELAPKFVWKSGQRHRIRLINITPNDTVMAALRTGKSIVKWRQVAKDGAEIAAAGSDEASQAIAVGETYDFEFDAPTGRHVMWLEFKSPGGRWYAQGQVIVQQPHVYDWSADLSVNRDEPGRMWLGARSNVLLAGSVFLSVYCPLCRTLLRVPSHRCPVSA